MKIVMIAGAILLLGGGGAGAYLYLMPQAEASVSEEDAEAAKAAELAEKKKNRKPGLFVELDPLILPIVDDNGISQVVTLVVAIEVNGIGAESKAHRIAPKLKSEFLEDIYGVVNAHAAQSGGPLEIMPLKKRLNKISRSLIGEEEVYDVLLQVVQQQPV
tara:strand:+ start:424 stop:903 length:480 start_codon:yes stop_codon:yes gene_type:complete